MFHLSVKTISRSAGRSATAAIAYRAGERIVDDRTGLVHDYTRRKGIENTEIFAPENAPAWAHNRAELWNAAELAETRKNSTVAREFEVAIPAELNKAQRLELVREFARELVQRHGMAVDVAIHEPGKEGDHRNHHAHILCSTRRLTPEGFKDKTRELDEQKSGEVVHWRERWAVLSNQHLENAGRQERIDHRSLEAQRAAALERGDVDQAAQLDRVPTIHIGPNVVEMELRGIRTERGDQSREIGKRNAQIIDLAEARKRIETLRANHERTDRGRTNQAANRDPGRVNQPDPRSIGQEPPPFARGRLRNLSELGVVCFTARSEMLLPRDVSGHMEHHGEKPDHALRRSDNGLKGDVSAEQLRELVKVREGERLPREAANDANPEKIKAEWQAERARQFTLMVNKARQVQTRATGQMERQDGRLKDHDQARPQEPTGFFAGMKKKAHAHTLTAWRDVRAGLETRWKQLQSRLHLIGDYMRKAGPYEMPTRGERLAEQKAAQARPDLAASIQRVIEKEKAAALAAQRAKIKQRQHRKQEQRAMKQESIEELKQRTDANRMKAEKAERDELEKAGRLASLQEQSAEQEFDGDQITGQQADSLAKELNAGTDKGDQAKEARRKEILERFKEKARSDRDKDRGRGG